MANLLEIRSQIAGQIPAEDAVRRFYLDKLHDIVENDIILYATRFSQTGLNIPGDFVSINAKM